MCSAESREIWGRNARTYCETNDLYSMVETTVDYIISRAERKRRVA